MPSLYKRDLKYERQTGARSKGQGQVPPMTVAEFLVVLKECPLIASVQASPGSPLDDPETLLKLARASLSQGVKVLRLEGVDNIKRIRGETGVPVIGLIKRHYSDSDIYITPTIREVEELLETGCEVIAMDATERSRPGNAHFEELVAAAHRAGRLVLGDCDTLLSLQRAQVNECDLVSTTLAGYTRDRSQSDGPDLHLLAAFCGESKLPVLAEGRYERTEDVTRAVQFGARGVVIGGSLNDPVKQTAKYVSATKRASETLKGNVGAVDVGGTWIRYGVFTPRWELIDSIVVNRHDTNCERLEWIEQAITESRVERVGISSGGVICPRTGNVSSTKETIPNNLGFSELVSRADIWVRAINDGLASAWGHACHPQFYGKSTFTLALGTGVGAGFVHHGQLLVNKSGDYLHVNDLLLEGGRTVEETIGGLSLSESVSDPSRRLLPSNIDKVVKVVKGLYQPELVIICGSVGVDHAVADAFRNDADVVTSPFGADAGLYGAAALALFPPKGVFQE